MATTDRSLWWYLLIFTCLFAWVVVLGGCDDATPPEMRYLGEPIIEAIGHGGPWPRRFDAWSLDEEGWPIYAAFGYTVRFEWLATEEPFEEPGIHVFATLGEAWAPWEPVLGGKFVTGSGADRDGDPDGITLVSGDDGIVKIYCGMRGWPHETPFETHVGLQWQVDGLDGDFYAPCIFAQETASFFRSRGGLEMSTQADWPYYGYHSKSQGLFLIGDPNEPAEPNEVPFEIDPAGPLPKVLVGDIPSTSTECASSEEYPPSNDPNANDKSILIHSRWMKVRAESGGWGITPAPFITLLPYDSNDVTSIAETAWPYTVCFHAPAESEGMVTVNAKLSIVDPNGAMLTAIDIIVHEVGQCLYCDDGWLWRSDYILPLASGYRGPLLTWAGDVLVVWLPPGHTMKLRPPDKVAMLTKVAIFTRLAQKWWTADSVLDRNGDGIVNFTDYGILLGME